MIQWHPAPPILPLSPTPPQPGKCTNMHQLTLHTVGVAVSLCHLLLTLTCWSQPNIVFSRLQGIEAVFPSFRFTCFPSEINGEQLFLQWWNVMGIVILLKRHNLWTPQPLPWASMIKLNMLNGSLPCQSACRTNGHAVKEIHDIWHSMTFQESMTKSSTESTVPMYSDVPSASTALAFCVQRFTTFVERVTSHITTVRVDSSSAPVPSSKMETSNHLFRGRKLEKPWTFRCHVAILVYYGNPSILRLIGRWYLWGPWCLIQQLREFLLALCMPWETENPLLWWRTTGLEQTPTWEMTR